MRFHLLIFLLIALTVGCGPGNGKNKAPMDPLAEALPTWASVSYTKDGVRTELYPPYIVTQQVFADAATGSCAGATIELTFAGTYNPSEVSRLEITGLSATPQYSGSTFIFVACMAPGSALVTVTAYNKNGAAIRNPLTVSVNAMTATKTVGFGHPNYPNTGFNVISAAPPLVALNSGSVKMANAYVGSIAGKSTDSTGNIGYKLETGFANYLNQASP